MRTGTSPNYTAVQLVTVEIDSDYTLLRNAVSGVYKFA